MRPCRRPNAAGWQRLTARSGATMLGESGLCGTGAYRPGVDEVLVEEQTALCSRRRSRSTYVRGAPSRTPTAVSARPVPNGTLRLTTPRRISLTCTRTRAHVLKLLLFLLFFLFFSLPLFLLLLLAVTFNFGAISGSTLCPDPNYLPCALLTYVLPLRCSRSKPGSHSISPLCYAKPATNMFLDGAPAAAIFCCYH